MIANSYRTLRSHAKLQMQIQFPNVEDIYLQGCEEGQKGIVESANPFSASDENARVWSDGWWDAFYGEKALFDLEGNVYFRAMANETYKKVTIPSTRKDRFRKLYPILKDTFTGALIGSLITIIAFETFD